MKIFIQLLILFTLFSYSKWEEVKRPISVSAMNHINTGTDFIVGIGNNTPHFSFDEGNTWEERRNGLPVELFYISKIIVYNDIIYMTIFNEYNYFYYTSDKGINWNILGNEREKNHFHTIADFTIDYDIIYTVNTSNLSIIKSSNLGQTWDTLPKWDIKHSYMRLIEVKGDTIIVATKSPSPTINQGLLVSTDKGNTWQHKNNNFDASNIECIKLYKDNIMIGKKDGFYYTEDLGETFRRASGIAFSAFINKIEIINNSVYLATNSGLLKSNFEFRQWENIRPFEFNRIFNLHYGNDKLFLSKSSQNFSNELSFYSNNLIDFDTLNFKMPILLLDFEIDYPSILFSSFKFTTNQIYKIDGNSLENIILYDYNNEDLIRAISKYEKIIIAYIQSFNRNQNNNVILFTTNNGLNWIEKEIISSDINIYDILLLNNNEVLVATNEGVFYSNDLTETWDILDSKDIEINDKLKNVKNFLVLNNNIYWYGKGVLLESNKYLMNWKSILNSIDESKIDKVNHMYDKEIFDLSISKSNIYAIGFKGFYVDHSTVDLFQSTDKGKSWNNLIGKFSNYEKILFRNVFAIEDYVFVSSNNGIYFSKDNGEIFEELNDGLSIFAKANGGEFHLYGDKILFCSPSGIFYRDLEELGITLSVETRNYLWTNPPYPQPTNSIVKVETYWDNALPFTEKDIEIYDITGVKINTANTLTVQKESAYKGQIIWDASNYKTGIYIMKITHGTETRVRKIMVVE